MFLVNKRSRIVFLFSIFLCLLFTAGALTAERAVIIGFHQRPGPAEQTLVLSAGFNEDLNGDGLVNNRDVRLHLQGTAQDLGDQGKDDVYGYGLVNAAAAVSAPVVIHLTVTTAKGAPANSAETVSLAGTKIDITIVNDSLSAIDVDVYEAGALVKELSESFRFGGKNQSEVTFGDLDAKDMAYHVVFVPKGKEGAFATVDIREVQ
jgi:hypothetical protein